MNSIASSNPNLPILEKRLVSLVTFSMLFILVGLLAAAVLSSENTAVNISALLVLAWPASLLILSLPNLKNNRVEKATASIAESHAKEQSPGEFFPSWLGSNAYNAACANSSN